MPVLWNKRRWNVDGDVTMGVWYKASFVFFGVCRTRNDSYFIGAIQTMWLPPTEKSEFLLKNKAIIIIAYQSYVIHFLIWFG
jgi:hypothetical protein